MTDTYTLIKPFTAKVNASGNAFVDVTHSIHGLAWQVMQVGLGLGVAAPSPQCAALVNGVPFVSSVLMAPSVFASLSSAPIAMTSEFSGVPFPTLEAGDVMKIGVTGATSGDIFTVGVYINEIDSPATTAAIRGAASAYLPRAGTSRWWR
jgi:hypothetical protein